MTAEKERAYVAQLIATGLVDAADLDAAMALWADWGLRGVPVMMAAWGRRRA